MEFKHISVLLNETIDGLNINQDGIYVDGTLGGGGHTKQILDRLSNRGSVIGVDQDMDAINATKKKLKDYSNIKYVHNNFSNIRNILKELNIEKIDGAILDLGVSSYQFDNPERGFSYRFDSPLDMRMDRDNKKTAKDIVNDYDEISLYRIIRDYGEDKFAKNIAKHICKYRNEKEIETTFELVEIIKQAIPMKFRIKGGHPAKRTFQALRVELNRELEILDKALDDFIELLNPGGRLCVITFQSLEDRIVKENFKRNMNPCTCPPGIVECVCGKKSKGNIITRKPIIPSEIEININPRSESSKLRIFERI